MTGNSLFSLAFNWWPDVTSGTLLSESLTKTPTNRKDKTRKSAHCLPGGIWLSDTFFSVSSATKNIKKVRAHANFWSENIKHKPIVLHHDVVSDCLATHDRFPSNCKKTKEVHLLDVFLDYPPFCVLS